MKIKLSGSRASVAIGFIATSLCVGCATPPPTRTVPPLYAELPKIEVPQATPLLKIPVPPPQKPIPVTIKIPKQITTVSAENAIMRRGTLIKTGASVVIGVPSSLHKIQNAQVKTAGSLGVKESDSFRTDGFFNDLEQYVERELLAVGFYVKDRSIFEAKLRDLRDGLGAAPAVHNDAAPARAAAAALAADDGKAFSMNGLFERGRLFVGALASLFIVKGSREEIYDTAEVIRAAQDGAVSADYVLQVNDLSVRHYTGEPLSLASRPEVQAVLGENPGLRVGAAGENGDAIPAKLEQPWLLSHFTAKLINVKTGTIDWIGDYSVESLAVLDEGMIIEVGGRRITSNGKTIVDALVAFNERLQEGYQKVQLSKASLENMYREVMQPITYQGDEGQGAILQAQRKAKVGVVERMYADQVRAYASLSANLPPEAKMEWGYYYVLDQPTVTPDLANPKTETEGQRLLKHVRALGSKITHDLLGTVKVTE